MKQGGLKGGGIDWKTTIGKLVLIAAAVLAIWFLIAQFMDDSMLRYWKFRSKKVHDTAEHVFGFFSYYKEVVALALLVWACLIAGTKSEKWRFIMQLLLAATLVAVPVWLGKIAVPRVRPKWFQGTRWTESFQNVTEKFGEMSLSTIFSPAAYKDQSFISGDAAIAFAISAVFACHFPAHRAIFYVLAVGCAVSRFVFLHHWPSDIFLGAVVGYLVGRAVLVLTGDVRVGT